MARYGSKAIRGHGIPEAMEQVLTNESRIPARITFLKPVSSAISIGTGGPFGAEGPIIATGGALGSVSAKLSRRRRQNARRFWLPVRRPAWPRHSAALCPPCLLAVELLLFEFRPRSIVPVAFAAVSSDRRSDGISRAWSRYLRCRIFSSRSLLALLHMCYSAASWA